MAHLTHPPADRRAAENLLHARVAMCLDGQIRGAAIALASRTALVGEQLELRTSWEPQEPWEIS